METERIEVGGMSCGHCVAQVRAALEEMDGVEVRSVEIGEATVRWAPDRVDRDRISEAILAAGYTPK